jgi:hypothetical protein
MTSTATRPETPGGAPGAPAGPPARPGSESRSGLAGLLDLPAQAVRSVMRSTRSTPGRLTLIAILIVVLSLVTGLVAVFMAQDKKGTINDLIDHREPLAAASQEVYRSLSDADATAASAFLSTGTEPPELRTRYQVDIARAGAALSKAASDSAGAADASSKVDVLTQQLPVYTGLVETARVNNRFGYPVGASYLREASELMRSKLLPASQELYRIDTDRLEAEQDDATGFPWLTTLLVLALIAALVVTQRYLTRRTNRLLNVGLVTATGAVVLMLLWGAVALIVQGILVGDGKEGGTHQVDVLVRARITALQARADETLTLVARGDGSAYEKDFGGLAVQLAGQDHNGGLLAEARGLVSGQSSEQNVQAATQAAGAWLNAHAAVRQLDDSGDYDSAVKTAIDSKTPDASAAAFLRLDDNLEKSINVGRQNFLDDTRGADRVLILLAPGVAVLAIIAAGGATMGIRERLREYR